MSSLARRRGRTPENRLPTTARRLSRFALLLAVGLPAAVALQFSFFPPAMLETLAGVEWNGVQRLLGAGVALLPAGAISLALLSVARICREYAVGELFSDVVLRSYRRLGVALAATTALHWLHPTLLGLALAPTLPSGKRFLTVGVQSDDLLLVLVTGLVFLLGAVMQVARRLQTENAEIV